MSALTGFCTLRHLDLNFFCAAQIFAGNTETPRRDLFYRAVLIRSESCGVFAALTGVRFTSEGIHRNRHTGMRFLGD